MNHTLAGSTRTTMWNRNFICVFIANAMLSLSHSSINTLVSTYADHLGAGAVLVGLLTGMFFGVSLAMRPISGPLSTKLDNRTLMIFVFILGGFVNIGYALFETLIPFVIFRFFHGLQYSIVGSLIMTVAGDSLPREKMASGMGIYSVGGAVAFAFGPALGNEILEYGTKVRDSGFGFKLVFLFSAVALFLAVIPSVMLTREKRTKEDIASTGAWYKNIISIHTLPTAVVMTLLCVAYSLYNGYLKPFAEENGIGGFSIFFTIVALVIVLVRPLSGKLTDKYGVYKIMIPCLVIFGLSFLVVGTSKSLISVLIGGVLAAIGYGATQPILQAMAIQTETPLKRGVASNTLYAGIDLGYFVGPFIGSVVYVFSGYRVMMMSAVVPITLSIILFILFWPKYVCRINELNAIEDEPEKGTNMIKAKL